MQCPVSCRRPCKRRMNSQECFFFPFFVFFIYYRENRFVFQASKNIYVPLSSSVCYEQTEVYPYSGILILYYIDPDSVAALQMKGLRWYEIVFEETEVLYWSSSEDSCFVICGSETECKRFFGRLFSILEVFFFDEWI